MSWGPKDRKWLSKDLGPVLVNVTPKSRQALSLLPVTFYKVCFPLKIRVRIMGNDYTLRNTQNVGRASVERREDKDKAGKDRGRNKKRKSRKQSSRWKTEYRICPFCQELHSLSAKEHLHSLFPALSHSSCRWAFEGTDFLFSINTKGHPVVHHVIRHLHSI